MDYCCVLVMVIMTLFASCFGVGLSKTNEIYVKNFISWDDMKVDGHKIRLNTSTVYHNQSRVIVVDKNGGGDSITVQEAVNMVPEYNKQRVKIYILPGIYREKVVVPRFKPYISFVGNEGQMANTIISWHDKASDRNSNGGSLGTYRSASVTVGSDYFCATDITFENTVIGAPGEPGRQAVALRIYGDKAMFYKVKIVGGQDTLLDETGSHYFYHSVIQGSVDFISGKSRSLYQECLIQSTAKKIGAIAAHHRDLPDDNTGFSFVSCIITGSGKVYLGRAWGNYSRTIYSNCYFDNVIIPAGWSDWNDPLRHKIRGIPELGNRI
ncbi:pectinesterase QRT1 isoform X2 [Gossypium hirsutum]|uniref:Pectinesterase n=1 Tax=Gossypium hirsutum TaxID=3635 RepID=A0A1U8IME7_GOSHI|nr:pectinesterase QRT1-like isoform X2 [Gossypium hirsutum]